MLKKEKMEVSFQLVCPCNQKMYKNQASLKQHYKTQEHQYWEQKDHLITINRLENEVAHLHRLNVLLMERISELS